MKINRYRIATSILGIALIFTFCGAQQPAWQGTMTNENGVSIIKNPKTPLYEEEIASLEEVLSLGKAEGEGEYLFTQLRDLAVDDAGNIYTLDMKESSVKKFSATGKLLTSFGKKGQGPGELGRPFFMTISNNNEIVVEDAAGFRFVFFTENGEFIKNLSYGKMRLLNIDFDSSGNMIGGTIDMEKSAQVVNKVSPEIEILCAYWTYPIDLNPRTLNLFPPALRWAVRLDDSVICGNGREYLLEIYDPEGSIINKIYKDYDRIKITEQDIEEKKQGRMTGMEFSIPTHHNAFFRFILDDSGRIYVRTYEKNPGSGLFKYNIFDEEGKYITDLFIPESPHVIKNDHIYTIEEDQDGFHMVKKYKITWKT